MKITQRLLAAAALLAWQAAASGEVAVNVPVVVTFGLPLEAKLTATYGKDAAAMLRAEVLQAVATAVQRRAGAVSIAVVITDAAPTHPTRHQRGENPSLDPLRSVSRGGAELTGTVRGPDGAVIATVSHRHFASTLATGSPAGDAWADARIAIQQWAAELARKIPPGDRARRGAT